MTRTPNTKRVAIALAMLAAASGSVDAAVLEWTGDWTDSWNHVLNWSPQQLPVSGIFPNGAGMDIATATKISFSDNLGGGPCQGDLDGDGSPGFADLSAILAAWGPCPGCPEDLNGDGVVGFTDLTVLLSGWGMCP